MTDFAEWRSDIDANPESWLAAIIRSGESKLALQLIRNNPRLLHIRLGGNETPLLIAAYAQQREIAAALLNMAAGWISSQRSHSQTMMAGLMASQ